jgi:phosphohistidine phosphatase
MHLYLIRHAQAEEPSQNLPDADRKLTIKGLEQAKTLKKSLALLEVQFDCLISSPWRRARQTASALEGVSETLEVSELLAASPSPALLRLIAEKSQTLSSLALVGHQPWMGMLTSQLLLSDASHAAVFEYKKCSLYALEYTPSQSYLRFVLPSFVVRRFS